MALSSLKKGSRISVRWVLKSSGESVWYDAEIVKVLAKTPAYIVCHLKYLEDRDIEKGQVLHARDEGDIWHIPQLYSVHNLMKEELLAAHGLIKKVLARFNEI